MWINVIYPDSAECMVNGIHFHVYYNTNNILMYACMFRDANRHLDFVDLDGDYMYRNIRVLFDNLNYANSHQDFVNLDGFHIHRNAQVHFYNINDVHYKDSGNDHTHHNPQVLFHN